MMKLRTRTQFIRRVRVGARAKLVRCRRRAKFWRMRSSRDVMRHGQLHNAKLLRFVAFSERAAIHRINKVRSKEFMALGGAA